MTGGLRVVPNPTTLVVAQAHPSATARVDYICRILFPAGLRASPLTRGYLNGTLSGADGLSAYSRKTPEGFHGVLTQASP